MAWFIRCFLWLIFWGIPNWRTSVGIDIDQFYPFGLQSGDSKLLPADDESRESVIDIPLISNFEFFGQQCTFVSVSKHCKVVCTNNIMIVLQF